MRIAVLSTGHAGSIFNYYYRLLIDRHSSTKPTRRRGGCGQSLSFPLLSKSNHLIRCTRWFIPLLILPLPSSPPYFLILFLVSMIIHARPWYVPHVIVLNSSNFSQFLLYHTTHSPLSLLLLLATHPPHLIRVQFLGYKCNLCNGSHSGPLVVGCCATAGGHSPCRPVLVRCILFSSIRAV